MPRFISWKRDFTKLRLWKTARQKSMLWKVLSRPQEKRGQFLSRQKKDLWHPMALFVLAQNICTPVTTIIFPSGTTLEMTFFSGLFKKLISPPSSMNMNQSLTLTVVGFMRGLTVMSGFLMFTTTPGGLITMDDGYGIPFAVGPGSPMQAGGGASAIMAGGTGGSVWDGTGSRRIPGALHGFTGITDTIIMPGVRSAIGAIPLSFRTTTFTGVGTTGFIPYIHEP
jgi:hypothetical protein